MDSHLNSAARILIALLLPIPAISCGGRSQLLALEEAAPLEVCNGQDDDGDGFIDEDLPSTKCGVGVCAREVPGCMAGFIPTCEPGQPSPETCNQLDDDCDGVVDEELEWGITIGPVVVREDGERGDSSCFTCLTAFNPQVVSVGEELRVLWILGSGGDALIPNTHARSYDLRGEPLGPAKSIGTTRLSATSFAAAPSSRGRVLITGCSFRIPESRAVSFFLEEDGASFTETIPREPAEACGAMIPDGVWTGTHHLIGWTENTGPGGNLSLLDIADEEGHTVGSRELDPDGRFFTSPRFSAAHDKVLLVYGTSDQDVLMASFLSRAGEPVGEPVVLAVPTSPSQSMDVVATDRGWLVVLEGYDPGYLAIQVDQEGQVVDVRNFESDSEFYSLSLDSWGPGRFALLGQQLVGEGYVPFISEIDETGRRLSWQIPPEDTVKTFAWPSATFAGGRLWTTYSELGEEDHVSNRVMLMALGCSDD